MPFSLADHGDRTALVARIAPAVRAALEARRDEIVANSGNLARRAAVKWAFPTLLDEVPTLLKVAVDLIAHALLE